MQFLEKEILAQGRAIFPAGRIYMIQRFLQIDCNLQLRQLQMTTLVVRRVLCQDSNFEYNFK